MPPLTTGSMADLAEGRPGSAGKVQPGGSSILVVDDEDGLRDLLKESLEEQGYLWYTASNGDDALRVLATTVVDLAVVDVMMPGMTGSTLFQRVRERHPDVTIIFATALDDLSLAVEHLKNGAYDYLVKPVTPKRLRKVIEDALSKRRTTLEKNRHMETLEERVDQQARELEATMRKLNSLNRAFQADVDAVWIRKKPDRIVKTDILGDGEAWQGKKYTQESEKKRISEYLHGHVQSRLLVLQHRLSQCQEILSLEPQKASSLLGEIRRELRSVQENDIRRASHELYPSIVKIGLIPALRSLVYRFQHAIRIDLYVESAITRMEERDERQFPDEFRVGVYRIVEEALENVVKHAHASEATVAVHLEKAETISLDVSDNGCGFDPTSVFSASGLVAMKNYSSSLGGRCQITSVIGLGTQVHATLSVAMRTRVS